MDSAYRIVTEPPSVDDYLRVRKEAGLSERIREEAENGINVAWATALLQRIDAHAPNANINLLADPPGRRLYARHGFVETAPDVIGMRRV